MAGYNLRSRKRLKLEAPVPSTAEEETVEDAGPVGKALSNEYILAELFSHLSVSDLKSCRFVNRVWNQEATGQLIRKAPVVDIKHPSKRGWEILELRSTSWNFPIRKFAVHANLNRGFTDATPGQKSMLVHFWEHVASFAIHLSVQTECYPLFSRRKPKKATEFPRLKSLELHLVPGSLLQFPENESLPKDLDAVIPILQHAPRLQRLSLEFKVEEFVHEPTFCDLLKHVPWNQIQHLRLRGNRLEDCCFQTIVELGPTMQLKSFEMIRLPGHGSNSDPNINGFLKRQGPFLETLDLAYCCLHGPMADFTLLPQFSRLKILKINVGLFEGDGATQFLILSSFSKWFPVLESLAIGQVDWFQLERLFSSQDGLPVETMKELQLDPRHLDPEVELELPPAEAVAVIRRVIKIFPSVTKLGVPANREIMEAIEEANVWKDLTELTLLHNPWNGAHTDHALTGFSPDEWDQIRGMQPGSPEFQQKDLDAEGKILQFFHQLKTLNVEGRFSDASCRFVLLKLENLKSLNMRTWVGIRHQISEEAVREMRTKFTVGTYRKIDLW